MALISGKSAFQSSTKSTCPPQVDSLVDSHEIATKFTQHFTVSCANLTNEGLDKLLKNYISQRVSYIGSPILDAERFDAELVENVINDLKRGKAAGLEGLSSEHVINCHPILPFRLSGRRLGFATSTDISSNSIIKLMDLENIGSAVEFSMLSDLQADLYVFLYPLPVNGRHL